MLKQEFRLVLIDEIDDIEIGRRVFTSDPQEAATQYAESYDSGFYQLLEGDTIEVAVLDENGTVTKWKVGGELITHYYAEKLEG